MCSTLNFKASKVQVSPSLTQESTTGTGAMGTPNMRHCRPIPSASGLSSSFRYTFAPVFSLIFWAPATWSTCPCVRKIPLSWIFRVSMAESTFSGSPPGSNTTPASVFSSQIRMQLDWKRERERTSICIGPPRTQQSRGL
jgi:hypothetical protein